MQKDFNSSATQGPTEEDATGLRPSEEAIKVAKARGRPRRFDRVEALDQATRLFWQKGYEATSISDLTTAMGIGSPSLYAAFGSKEALYAEALDHYVATWGHLVWGRFEAAPTARGAAAALLGDSAAALTGASAVIPAGCMLTLSAVGSEGHETLGNLVRAGRAMTIDRLYGRLERGVQEGDVPASVDIRGLSRFIQVVQNGMSILARDGATRDELQAVAETAMMGWDSHVG